jgi:hypothetical protein
MLTPAAREKIMLDALYAIADRTALLHPGDTSAKIYDTLHKVDSIAIAALKDLER